MTQRRRTKRKRKASSSTMRRRMGLTGWGNSKPFFGWSKTLTTKTLGEGHNPGVLNGAKFTLPVNNWNDPLGDLGNLVPGSGSLTKNRHPTNHDDAIAIGYQRVQVLAWKAKIVVNWILNALAIGDHIIAYTFTEDANTEFEGVAGSAGRIERLEILTNPRWTVKRLEGHPGTDAPSSDVHVLFISVPNVFKYCQIIADGSNTREANNGSVSHALTDSNHTVTPPLIPLFCQIIIFNESGNVMAIDSLHITVEITQRVKIMRDRKGTEDMDEGEVDVHA